MIFNSCVGVLNIKSLTRCRFKAITDLAMFKEGITITWKRNHLDPGFYKRASIALSIDYLVDNGNNNGLGKYWKDQQTIEQTEVSR